MAATPLQVGNGKMNIKESPRVLTVLNDDDYQTQVRPSVAAGTVNRKQPAKESLLLKNFKNQQQSSHLDSF